MMREITGATAKMWGPAILGYGSHHYKYARLTTIDRENAIATIGDEVENPSHRFSRCRENISV